MIRISALSLACLCLAAPSAQAGAWPRKEGSGFVSAAVRLAWPQDVRQWTSPEPIQDYSTLFFEYGLTDRLTLGLDLGHSVSGSGKTVIFAQVPLRQAGSGPRVTAQIGFGMIAGERVLRPGLSIGWGLDKGWLSIDSVAEAHVEPATIDYKIDMTWGRNLSKDRKLILQLQTGQPAGREPFARFAPSIVVPVHDRFKVETGATFGLTGDESVGLKLGFWTEF